MCPSLDGRFARADPPCSWVDSLQNQALLAGLFALGGLEQGGAGGGLEDLAHTLVGASRALKVLVGANLLANFLTLQH